VPKTKKSKAGIDEIKVPSALVVRMADRMFKLNPTMREARLAKGKARIADGHRGKNDAAIVKALGG